MALATFHFGYPITSVTFNGKTATSSPASISYSATARISKITVTSGWSGTVYWDTTSAMSDPYVLATASNGSVTMKTANLTYTGSNRDVYFSASGSVASYTLTAGSMPNILSSVYFNDGTSITQSNKSCSFANTKYIRSISLTSAGLAWSGTLYWSSSSGGTTYPIADITNGSISYRSSIESIDFNNRSRTIYFTAVGQTTYKYRIHAMTTADGSYFSGGSQDYYAPSSSTWYTSTTVSNTFNLNNLPTPIRAYYKLVGWAYTNTTDTSQAHTGEVSVSGTTDGKVTNFYAVWSLAPTIVLSANGGVFQDTQSTTKEYPRQTPGNAFYFSGPSGLVSRTGYKLLGWSANDTATTAGYDPDGWVTVGNSTVQRYYAVWQKSRATLTFYGNGGLWNGNLQKQSKTYEVGETVSFATYSNNLVRAGHSLLGWSTSSTATTASWDPNGIVTVGATDADYYAVWQKHIDLFYWYGNDSQDAAKIAKGQPVTNLTATIWNEFKSRINQLTIAKTGRSWSYNTVSSGDSITAAEVLAARNALAALNNNVPLPTANQLQTGKQILASYFNGTGSLKAALNIIINNYNNS